MKTYIYHQDHGHGWLEVNKAELKSLGLEQEITSYSYAKGDKVYLEEDCDAALFLEKLHENGDEFIVQNVFKENTPIRNYDPYYPL
jgi:hypothetical protein